MVFSHRFRWLSLGLCALLAVGLWYASSWWPHRTRVFAGPVTALAVGDDGIVYALGSQGKGHFGWTRLSFGLNVQDQHSISAELLEAAFSPDGRFFTTKEADSRKVMQRFYQSASAKLTYEEGVSTSTHFRFSGDSSYVSSVRDFPDAKGRNFSLRQFDGAKPGRVVLALPQQRITSASFSADGKTMVLMNVQKGIQKWQLSPQIALVSEDSERISDSPEAARSIALSPEGNHLSYYDQTDYFYNFDSKSESLYPRSFAYCPAKPTPFQYSSGSEFLVVESGACNTYQPGPTLYNPRASYNAGGYGRLMRVLPEKSLSTAFAFSPDSRFLFVGDANGTITRWKLK